MTPTNEAGHGLPELPVPWSDYWASKGNWALSHNYAAFELADEWLRANLDALALSRGVPEGKHTCSLGEWCTHPFAECAPAADGGVRERAQYTEQMVRDASGHAWEYMGESEVVPLGLALELVQALTQQPALSSHRQTGAPVASIGELGGAKVIVLRNYDEIGDLPKGTKLYTAPPPRPDLSKFRELAERWRDGVGIDLETRLQCADELIALVEKGAGNG